MSDNTFCNWNMPSHGIISFDTAGLIIIPRQKWVRIEQTAEVK